MSLIFNLCTLGIKGMTSMQWSEIKRRTHSEEQVTVTYAEEGLVVDRQAIDPLGIKEVIPSQMFPIGHPFDSGLGNIDRLQPDSKFVGTQTPQPLARRPAMTGAAFGVWLVVA